MHFQEFACLWIRGIVPLSLIKEVVDKYPPSDVLFTVNSADSISPVKVSSKITIYGDASGGAFTRLPLLRRIGVGLACIDQEGKLVWAMNFNLPGSTQTVARGELFALLRAAQLAEEDSEIDFVTDNQGNHKKFNGSRENALLSNNGDMFKLLFEEITVKNLTFTCRWMPSHI